MNLAKTAVRATALLLATTPVLPAAAQSVRPVPAQPAKPAPTATPAPSAWTVSSDPARGIVGIMATAKGGAAQFVGSCRKSSEPGLLGAFSSYSGGGLRTDGQVEHVAFYVRGGDWQDAFSVRLRYSAAKSAWEFVQPLAPVFLNSFSRGATLAVVNNRNQEVFSFDLTGSTAAVKTLRTVCAIPVG